MTNNSPLTTSDKQRTTHDSRALVVVSRQSLAARLPSPLRRKSFVVGRRSSAASRRRGQFLIEAIVAGSVLIVGFTGIMALLARAMHTNRIVTNNYIGTYLAAEGIEIVKNILDHNVMKRIGCEDWCVPPIAGSGWNWDTGINVGGNDTWRVDATGNTPSTVGLLPVGGNPPLKFDAGTKRYGYQTGANSAFRRTVTITKTPSSNPTEIEVVSRVWWSTGLLDSEVELVDMFWNWRP